MFCNDYNPGIVESTHIIVGVLTGSIFSSYCLLFKILEISDTQEENLQ